MNKTKITVFVGVLSALSFILYLIEFPLAMFFPPYLKIDFSDVPAILGGIIGGPVIGVAIQLIKNMLHFLFLSKTPFGSGEIANFFAGIGFIVPVALIMRRAMKNSLLAYVVGAISMVIIVNIMNYYVSLPLYGIPLEARWPTILYSLIPFNLVKAVLVSIVTALLFNSLKSVLSKYQINH